MKTGFLGVEEVCLQASSNHAAFNFTVRLIIRMPRPENSELCLAKCSQLRQICGMLLEETFARVRILAVWGATLRLSPLGVQHNLHHVGLQNIADAKHDGWNLTEAVARQKHDGGNGT